MPTRFPSRALRPRLDIDRSRVATITIVLALFSFSLVLRVTDTDAMVNVDMFHLWSKRIVRFVASIESGRLTETYQSHHPGVVLMWLVGAVWRYHGVLHETLDPHKLKLAVMPVAVVGALLPPVTYLLMKRALGRTHTTIALVTAVLFATEPMFVAHSRNAHLDMLVTAFAWSALLATIIAQRELSMKWGILSGVLLGLALLTKLSSAGIALGIALLYLHALTRTAVQRMKLLRVFAVTVAAALLITFTLWPALWLAPIETLSRLRSGLDQEVNKTAEFMLFGDTGKLRLPRWIYGLFLVYLVTPEFWGPGIVVAWAVRHSDPQLRAFVGHIVVGTLPLVVLLLLSRLVGTRYIIPALPLFGTMTAIVMVNAAARFQSFVRPAWMPMVAAALVLSLLGARSLRLADLHPLPITYCSRWTSVDCAKVFHIGWGEGLREASRIVASQAKFRGYADPPRIYGSGYASTMRLWVPMSPTNTIEDAQLLVEYLPDRLRRLTTSMTIEEHVGKHHIALLGEVKLQGRTYVRVFAGPKY